MDTLYDLLGALPRDDAEGLRAAFRRAVKGAHPDLNPGDPDAGLKFRHIVRANEILADVDQRAAYDHLLELARLEQAQASKHAAVDTIYKAASAVIALTAAAVAAAGLYLLSVNLPASVFPSANGAATATRGQAAAVTAAAPPTEPAVTGSAATAAEASAASGNAPAGAIQPIPVPTQLIAMPSEAVATPPGGIGPPLDISPKGASSSRVLGVSTYRGGDPHAGIARAKRIARARHAPALARTGRQRLARAAPGSRARAARRRRMARLAPWRHEEVRRPGRP